VLRHLLPLPSAEGDGFVFPGLKPGRALSNMAMLKLLARMGHGDLTVHGFRSAFRDWAAEATHAPHAVAEAALAHAVADKVEAAYRRGDLFEKRRQLMQDWADYCTRAPAAAVALRGPAEVSAGADSAESANRPSALRARPAAR
jgi:integrase